MLAPIPIKVSIVEDDSRIRESLFGILEGAPGFRCLKSYATGEEALEGIPLQRPDIVLMDIQLPKMSGIECVARLKEKAPDLPIVMLTVFEDSDKVFKALEAGACGYLVKRTPPQDLLEALRQVQSGGAPMTGRVARMVVQSFQRMGASQANGGHALRYSHSGRCQHNRGGHIHWFVCMRLTDTGNPFVTTSYPGPVLAY